ncbi:MAG: metalloregulator ArsR/SmtB family transcription factor [Acidobacteriaceae bacterium]
MLKETHNRDLHLDCARMGDFFMIFAHATRMRIFCALQNGSKTVTRIAEEADISVSNASQHLRLMRDRGAVVSVRHGQTVLYGVADPRFFMAANLIREALLDRNGLAVCPADGGDSRPGGNKTSTQKATSVHP